MPAATATNPWTPPPATSSPPPVATGGPQRRTFSSAPPPAATSDDGPYSDQLARAAASSSPRRLASLPTAAAVSVTAFVFGAATALVMPTLVAAASGHSGVSLGERSTAAVLAGAGFACAYAAGVLALWRGGRLHPAAVASVGALALVAVVSGAGPVGALVPIAGGALAIHLGAGDHVRRDPRPVIVLLAAACMLSVLAGALAPATRAHRPAPSAAAPAGPHPLPPAATAAPSHTHMPTTAASSPHGAPAAPGPAAQTGATPIAAATAPAAPLTPADVAAATRLVHDFYAALDAQRFTAAWATLPPAVQTRFGGFATWRSGYRATISSRPESISVSAASGGALVRLTLVATDRTACGPRTARFAVRWWLVRGRTSWGAASLEGAPLDSHAPACG